MVAIPPVRVSALVSLAALTIGLPQPVTGVVSTKVHHPMLNALMARFSALVVMASPDMAPPGIACTGTGMP